MFPIVDVTTWVSFNLEDYNFVMLTSLGEWACLLTWVSKDPWQVISWQCFYQLECYSWLVKCPQPSVVHSLRWLLRLTQPFSLCWLHSKYSTDSTSWAPSWKGQRGITLAFLFYLSNLVSWESLNLYQGQVTLRWLMFGWYLPCSIPSLWLPVIVLLRWYSLRFNQRLLYQSLGTKYSCKWHTQ